MDRTLRLLCHPETPLPTLRAVSARAERKGAAGLLLEYALDGDIATLRVPALAAPRRAGELWRHTCLEAFVGTERLDAYAEINLAPSGEWAAWSFERYRAERQDVAMPEPRFDVVVGAASLELRAEMDLSALPWLAGADTWRVGLAAVLESRDGTLSYWALAHPPGKPDFHAPAGWRCILQDPPGR